MMCWNSYQSHKSQPYHLLGEIREWINNPANSIKFSITAPFTQGEKMHMLYRRSLYSQTKFSFFSLLSLHQIICYGFSVMKIFGSSLRSLNISFSLKIKIMPQLDGDNVANTLEAIVASRVEPSHMYVWHLIRALEIPQSCLLWSELFQWCLKINWIFKNVSFSYRSWWPNGWGCSVNGIYCHLQYHLTLFDSFHQS